MLNYGLGAVLIACCVPTVSLADDAARDQQSSRARASATPGDYRLHAARAERATIVDAPGSPFHTGFGGSMVAVYPFPDSGIHASAGGRLSGRPARQQSNELDAARLLGAPRLGGRAGRRSRPAALIGVDRRLGNSVAIGLDGGATLGRIDSSPGRLARPHMGRGPVGGSGGNRGEGRINQMARLTALFRF